MTLSNSPLLNALFWVAASVWLGGYVAIAVVMYAARKSLEASGRIAFFRTLGRAYLPVGATALAVMVLSGLALHWTRSPDALTYALLLTTTAVVIVLTVAVAQARRMTVLRQELLQNSEDSDLAATARRTGRAAVILRALLGLLSLAIIVLAAALNA